MSRVAPELDVRTLPPPGRHPEIFRTFEALRPGEAFVLVTDHEPKPLLYQFQAERPGLFEWSVLEAGPERYRVEIRRRLAPGPRDVSEYMEGDHRRLDAIMADVSRLVSAASFAEAGRRLAEFSCGLDRHIEMEEHILFPAFENATGMTQGPTAAMRMEHVEIRRLMQDVASAARGGDAARFAAAAGALREVLGGHNAKEEQVLYPTADQTAGGERERDDLVRRMQAL